MVQSYTSQLCFSSGEGGFIRDHVKSVKIKWFSKNCSSGKYLSYTITFDGDVTTGLETDQWHCQYVVGSRTTYNLKAICTFVMYLTWYFFLDMILYFEFVHILVKAFFVLFDQIFTCVVLHAIVQNLILYIIYKYLLYIERSFVSYLK